MMKSFYEVMGSMITGKDMSGGSDFISGDVTKQKVLTAKDFDHMFLK